MAEDLTKLDNWLNKTEDKLDGGKIQRPGNKKAIEFRYYRPLFKIITHINVLQAVLLTRAKR